MVSKSVAGTVQNFHKHLQARVKKAGGHFEQFYLT